MSSILRKARPGEEDTVYAMIRGRVEWMDIAGIHQWNETGYLKAYPPEYYRAHRESLYVLEEGGQILAAAMLFRCDARWEDGADAFYIHNFVSAAKAPGAGKIFMKELETLAKGAGIACLRLDSAADNGKLTAYYERLGFMPRGTCREGDYRGILREKRL